MITATALVILGHLLMLAGMAAVMLLRPADVRAGLDLQHGGKLDLVEGPL